MDERKKATYLPKERDYFEQAPRDIRAYSQKDSAKLPDPVRNPIVVNNISNVEFDYTYGGTEDEK